MEEELARTLETVWDLVRAIEPARGKVLSQQVLEARTALERMAAAYAQHRVGAKSGADATAPAGGTSDGKTESDDDIERGVHGSMATIYARAGAVAIAAGDEANAERWLAEAERLSPDDDQRAEIATARRSHERYRALVHGRNLIACGHESDARKIWKQLTLGESDAITRAADVELKAPRPLGPDDKMPTLSRFNGIGAGFYGRRDPWPDGSYATTHCVSVLWIPLVPLSAWRVRDDGGGYQVFAREQLSTFARVMRWAVPSAIALAIAVYAVVAFVGSPERLARLRWDDALEAAQHGTAEAALRGLDGELDHDLAYVDAERAERAGAEVVRLTAGYVATPFAVDKLDQAIRVVHRYQALPHRAQPGPARAAILDRLGSWARELGDGLDTAEARLALLGPAAEIAAPDARGPIETQITAERLALAAARQADWPLDALAILIDPAGKRPAAAAVERADAIVERLCAAPSLLADASVELDAWANATSSSALRDKAIKLRDAAVKARAAAEAEGLTAKQLAEMGAAQPGDQFVQLRRARNEADSGNLDGAAARLTRIGAPGMTIRAARLMLAQIAAAQGKLEAADAQLTALLGTRLQRFTAASVALRDAAKAAQGRIENDLKTGNVPFELRNRFNAARESERDELIRDWISDQMKKDDGLSAARTKYVALADIVPVALASGTTKLRRAQAMSGAARDAMLHDAERAFLAIRTEAEGQPTFRLALGEIYARLGKTAESDAELAAVLAQKDPELSLQVARVHRAIGSVARAKQIATDVFATASGAVKESAAVMLGLLSEDNEDESESWFRKADRNNPFVKASLLHLEASRLEREGKAAECAAKFAEVAKLQLAATTVTQGQNYNNAAVAYERGFDCNSDPQALRDADAALETAYRRNPEDPIVVGNLAQVLGMNGRLRVLARHIDVRALRLRLRDVQPLLGELLAGSERTALLAELAQDPSLRKTAELAAQEEVLAPNRPSAYEQRFAWARERRDVEEAAAIVDRARRAKALDVSDANEARERWRSGAEDAKYIVRAENTRARLDSVLTGPTANRLDPRTRAAGWYLMASALSRLGLHRSDKAALVRAREAAATAMRLWPALDADALIVEALIDEAGLELDARTWSASRRDRRAVTLLDQLVSDGNPLGARIRASKQWAEVAAHATLVGFPELGDVRIARLLGDAALEARAKAVFDDKLVRVSLELALLLDPGDPAAKQDLAYFDRR